LRSAVDLGLTTFGENRVQEAEAKAVELPDARWELIGRLQSNKAGRAVALFDVIHSVDSVDLAHRLDRLTAAADRPDRPERLPVYLEINVDDDSAKAGFRRAEVEAAIQMLAALDHLELRGLMTVGRRVERPEQARPTFEALRRLSERLRRREPRLGGGLSMGMSSDFELAIEEGSTVVRVGSALFGARAT
jgi:hypothetical protein